MGANEQTKARQSKTEGRIQERERESRERKLLTYLSREGKSIPRVTVMSYVIPLGIGSSLCIRMKLEVASKGAAKGAAKGAQRRGEGNTCIISSSTHHTHTQSLLHTHIYSKHTTYNVYTYCGAAPESSPYPPPHPQQKTAPAPPKCPPCSPPCSPLC